MEVGENLNWSPEAEIVERHNLYLRLIHHVRKTKPGRVLFTSWPMSDEGREVIKPSFSYTVFIDPGQFAGNHFHHEKAEVFIPLREAEIHLENPQTKERVVIKIENNPKTKNTVELIAIKPGIAHTVKNPSPEHTLELIVLANTSKMGPDDFDYKII